MQRSKITKILAAAVLAVAVGPLGLAAANANAATFPAAAGKLCRAKLMNGRNWDRVFVKTAAFDCRV